MNKASLLALPLFLLAAGSALAAPAPAPPTATFAPGTILGVRPGMDRDDGRCRLEAPGHDARHGGRGRQRQRRQGQSRRRCQTKSGEGRGRRGGGAFRTVDPARDALRPARRQGRPQCGHVTWVTGFVRPGQEIPFLRGSGTPKPPWSSGTAWPSGTCCRARSLPQLPYRLIARGVKGRAQVGLADLPGPAEAVESPPDSYPEGARSRPEKTRPCTGKPLPLPCLFTCGERPRQEEAPAGKGKRG